MALLPREGKNLRDGHLSSSENGQRCFRCARKMGMRETKQMMPRPKIQQNIWGIFFTWSETTGLREPFLYVVRCILLSESSDENFC